MTNDDSNIEWVFSFDTEYTDIGARDGLILYGKAAPTNPEGADGDDFFQVVGFEIADFETFWQQSVESDQDTMDKLLALSEEAFGEPDLDRIFYMASREPALAKFVVRGWLETSYEGDDLDPFKWVVEA